jgi:aspartyl-tRNA(Asn)/glutamyl-tRNA(Gln) amidotransferase subunit B
MQTVIGLEIHCQLQTATKVFCSDSTAFGASPNTQISAISLGLPGTLPRLNEKVVEGAVRLGLALGCAISRYTTFDRKNYFYADLPKGFQTTQNEHPICVGGTVDFELENTQKSIRLHHIHIEDDAGKSIHDLDADFSLIDLNRAGVPLLEIVTEPDLRSADEAVAVLLALRQIVRTLGISDGNMEEGSLRCDCNVSVRADENAPLGQRCEIKNLNSTRNIKRAIAYEVARQTEILVNGSMVEQQTRSFDADAGTTFALRSKEDAHDYRYFPEPDLPPVVLSQRYIDEIQATMPLLPREIANILVVQHALSNYDARLIAADSACYAYFTKMTELGLSPKNAVNWLLNFIQKHLNAQDIAWSDFGISPNVLFDLIVLVEQNTVTRQAAETKIFAELLRNPTETPLAVAERLNLIIIEKTTSEIDEIIQAVLQKFPQKVTEYQKGKKGLIGFFVGEVTKAAKGKIDPKAANEALVKMLIG